MLSKILIEIRMNSSIGAPLYNVLSEGVPS